MISVLHHPETAIDVIWVALNFIPSIILLFSFRLFVQISLLNSKVKK